MASILQAQLDGRLPFDPRGPLLHREDLPELQEAEEAFIRSAVKAAGAIGGSDPYGDPMQQAVTAEAMCVTERANLRAVLREALRDRGVTDDKTRADFLKSFLYGTRRGVIALCRQLIAHHQAGGQAIVKRRPT